MSHPCGYSKPGWLGPEQPGVVEGSPGHGREIGTR